ncbi:MAG: hypothetical protein Q4F65_05710 [Propionibacteriaceae bacterium]|nr:hypothetical protein [Propionibacteriaceae bacterium]
MTTPLRPVPTHGAPRLPEPPQKPVRPTGSVSAAEFERFAELAKEGKDLDAITKASGRSRATVVKYLTRMLPLNERACPEALLVERLGGYLSDDYDWRAAMVQAPPPPVVTHVHREGVPGLDDNDLVTIALALAEQSGARARDLAVRVVAELTGRNVTDLLCRARERRLLSEGMPPNRADEVARAWVQEKIDPTFSGDWRRGYERGYDDWEGWQ